MSIRVSLDEIVSAKDAARGLREVLDRLERGASEQFVITRRNRPEAVIVSVNRFERLLAAQRQEEEVPA
jgi:prevent-host-death family protein